MKPCCSTLCLLVFFGLSTYALRGQVVEDEAFAAMPAGKRLEAVYALPVYQLDTQALAFTLDRLLAAAERKKDQRCVFALKYRRFVERLKLKIPQSENVPMLEELEKMAKDNRWETEQVVVRHYAAFEQYSTRKMPQEQMYAVVLNIYDRMEKIGFEQFRPFGADAMLYHLSSFMWDLNNLEKTHQYLSVAERFLHPEEPGGFMLTLIYNLHQSYYQEKKDFPNAIAYAQKIYDYHKNQYSENPHLRWRSWFWQGLALLDIASMRIEQGDLAEGERCATLGYALSQVSDPTRHSDAKFAEFDALQVLIAIKLKLGKVAEAAPLVQRSDLLKTLLRNAPDPRPFHYLKFYRNCARYHELKKDYPQTLHFIHLAQDLQDSLDTQNDARTFEHIQQRMDAEKYQEKIQLVEHEKQLQTILSASFLLVLLLTLALGWVNFSRLRTKRQLTEAELTAANERLGSLTDGLHEKSAAVEKMRLEIEKISADDERSKVQEALARSAILTNEDWLNFRLQFEKVHPRFIDEQTALYPDVTSAELRLLVFERLGLDDAEIANLLGISRASVKQTRWRMRKKM